MTTVEEEHLELVGIKQGLYQILPRDPIDDAKGQGGIIRPLPILPPLYATADDEDNAPIILKREQDSWYGQLWQVVVVDERRKIYNINRADFVVPIPPTFAVTPPFQPRKPITCVTPKVEKGDPNPYRWQILWTPPEQEWLQQDMYSVIPLLPGETKRSQYFVDDQTPLKQGHGEVEGQKAEEPKPDLVLTKLDSIRTQTWWFKPYNFGTTPTPGGSDA